MPSPTRLRRRLQGLVAALLVVAAAAPAAEAQDLAMPRVGTTVEFDNGAVYQAVAIVGDQAFVKEDTGDDRTIVHVLKYGRFDSLIFRGTSRSEIYFTQSSVEDMLGAEPNAPLDIAYEVYVDNVLNSRVNGVALRGEVTTIEVGGQKLAARPLALQLFFYDAEGAFQRNLKLTRFFSEDFGLPLRIEYENATSGESFVITAKRVAAGGG